MSKVSFRICAKEDGPAILDFLWSMKEEFHFSERHTVAEMIDLLFEKGGIIAGYRDNMVVGMFGYFLGEPSRDYTNRTVGFVYIAGIAKSYRCTRFFCNGAYFLATTLQADGVTELRCHAREGDAYTNGLYARLGLVIGKEKNRRGDNCVLYANSVENVLALISQRRKEQAAHTLEMAIAT